jgi:hypothetical protein
VAVGNIHGAIAAGRKDLKKVEARLNLDGWTKKVYRRPAGPARRVRIK